MNDLTASELMLREYAINMRDSCGMSYQTALRIVLEGQKELVAKAEEEVSDQAARADAEMLDELTPSGRMVVLSGRQAARGYAKESLGSFIKRRRRELEISVKDLGLACGCDASVITSIEAGDFDSLQKLRLSLLAKKLKVTLSALTELVPQKDGSGRKVRSKLEFTLDDAREAARKNPEANRAYELDGRNPSMGDASREAMSRACAYQVKHPEVGFREAVEIVFTGDKELYSRYDKG